MPEGHLETATEMAGVQTKASLAVTQGQLPVGTRSVALADRQFVGVLAGIGTHIPPCTR